MRKRKEKKQTNEEGGRHCTRHKKGVGAIPDTRPHARRLEAVFLRTSFLLFTFLPYLIAFQCFIFYLII